MKAVVLSEPGPAENLVAKDIERPAPGPGEVLVRVRAAGVCYRDVIDRRGGFPFMKQPVVPGHEFAGEVTALGDGAEGLALGDRVVNLHRAPCGECDYCVSGHEPRCIFSPMLFGLTIDGGYAEYVVAAPAALVALPKTVSFEEGCFLACTAGVALRGLRTRGKLQPGERVLITGASGGVGMHAIQVAKALGGVVIAVTSSESKASALRKRGADEVVVSADGAFHKQVRRLTDGGVHLVLDCVGVPTLNASLRSCRPMGRVVICGNVTIEHQRINPGYFILNEIDMMGTSGCTKNDLRQIFQWVADGSVSPLIAERLPLDHAADAHRRLEAKGVIGRLVLTP
jgi:D-arabinose 1-dehydrogenase-like Zn-dependent alcohol dehydrogenase